jgi:NADH-ubiquinone oxidoreductase chain 4
MILAGVLLKLGGYGLFRVVRGLGGFLGSNSIFYISVVLWGGVVTGAICLRQVDLKGLIAYSSVGHMGLFVGGIFRNNIWGWQGGLLMLLGHGLCSSGMFALANVNYERVGSRRILLNKGLLSLFPFLTSL